MEHPSTTDVSGEYEWPQPDLQALGALAPRLFAEFAGADAAFHGSLTWDGPPQRSKSYGSAAEWVAALAQGPDRADLSADAPAGRRVSLYTRDLRGAAAVTVRVTVSDADLPAADTLLRRLADELRLSPVSPGADGGAQVRIRREYLLRKPGDAAWLGGLLEALVAHLGPGTEGRGTVRFAPAPQVEHETGDLRALRDVLAERAGDLAWIALWLDHGRTTLHLTCDFGAREAALSVDGPDEQAVQAVVARVEHGAPLDPVSDEDPQAGRRREYYTRGPLDRRWLEAALTALGDAVPAARHPEGRYTRIGGGGETQVRRDPAVWRAEVLAAWDDLLDASLWLGGRAVNAALRIHPRRDYVSLEVQAGSAEKAASLLDGLAARLELDPADTGRQGQGHRRSARTFRVGRWGNKAFAEALDSAIHRAFDGRAPLLEEGFVEEEADGGPDLVRYATLDALLERVRKTDPYGEVTVRMWGSRDAGLGVYLSRKPAAEDTRRTLELRTSLGPDEFPDLVEIFKGPLKLEEVGDAGAETEGGGGEKKAGEWMKGFRGLVFSVLGTLIVSSGFWLSVLPRHELELTSPRMAEGDTLTLPDTVRSLPVEWVQRRTRFGRTRIERDAPATVLVRRVGEGQTFRRLSARPGVRVPVVPGATYDIEVAIDPIGARALTRVIIRPEKQPEGVP